MGTERTVVAQGRCGGALQRTEVHQCLIEVGGALRIEQLLGQLFEMSLTGRRVDGNLDAEDAREHAVDIPVDGGHLLMVGKGANGCGGVVTHAFEGSHSFVGHRKSAGQSNFASGGMQITCSRIVTQAFPELQHLVFGRCGQGLHVGEAREESLIVIQTLSDACLLQDDLADPNAVRVADVAPRQFALMERIPMEQELAKDA